MTKISKKKSKRVNSVLLLITGFIFLMAIVIIWIIPENAEHERRELFQEKSPETFGIALLNNVNHSSKQY